MLSMQEGCIMLFTYFFFFCRNKKGLLNFVSERIVFLKLVYRINNTWYSFKKNKLPFKLHIFKLKSISKYQLLLHWKSFENIWSFILYLEAGETQLINTCIRTVRDSRIWSEMSWNSIHTKIWTLKKPHHCSQHFNHEDINFM